MYRNEFFFVPDAVGSAAAPPVGRRAAAERSIERSLNA